MSTQELARFGGVVLSVSSTGVPVSFTCQSSSFARKLRRRFYYLVEQLPPELHAHAERVTFRVQGRLVSVEAKAWISFSGDSQDAHLSTG